MDRVTESANGSEGSVQPRSVTQAVKAVCALLGSVETLDITCALDAFNRACAQLSQSPPVNELVLLDLNFVICKKPPKPHELKKYSKHCKSSTK